jgi:fibronectin type 3 domain-containing protein
VRGTFFTNTRSIASYYSELSNGKMAVSGDVFGYFTLSMNTPTCEYATWGSAARQAAIAAGINLSAYTNVVHAFTKQSACWWGGMGQLPGKYSWLNGNLSLYVVSHELGHNFGAHHASSLTCTQSGSRVAFSSNCTADEYGDPYDVMGYGGERHMQAWHRKQLGFLTTSDQQTVTANGRYFVSTAEIDGGSPRILRVTRPSGKYYYLELRQPYGLFDNFTSTALAVTGVTIRIAPDTKVTQSQLIDAHPATSTFSDAPLKPGETFNDPVNGISITTSSISPTGAQLRIQLGPDTVAPAAPTDLSTTVPSPTSIELSWAAATDDLEVTGYRVTRDGVVLATVGGTSYSDGLDFVPGTTYSYSVTAVDGGGNASPPATTTQLMPDLIAPTQPSTAAAVQMDVRSVAVSWTASTDNVGVTGYSVTRNGLPLVTTGATDSSIVDAAVIDGFAYDYAITAFDAAGNRGLPASAAVSLPDVTAPSAPGTTTSTGLAVTSTTARVSWSPATDNVAVVGYTVTRDGVLTATLDPTATTFEETGLPSDTTYRYGLVAFDAAGNIGPETSFTVQLKSRDLIAPTTPANLKGTPLGKRRIQLTWSASTDDRAGTIQYRIFRGTTRIATVTTTSYVDRPAAVGWYTYKVRAVDVSGNKSAFTPTISVKARRTV